LEKHGELGRDNKSLLYWLQYTNSFLKSAIVVYNVQGVCTLQPPPPPNRESTPIHHMWKYWALWCEPWEPLVVASPKYSCLIDIFNAYTFKSTIFYQYWFDIRHWKSCSVRRKFCHSTRCLILYHFVLCTWCCFTNHFRHLYIQCIYANNEIKKKILFTSSFLMGIPQMFADLFLSISGFAYHYSRMIGPFLKELYLFLTYWNIS